ncbi:hypothetical protein [Streptomyces fagopyri]|uniref:hypothetical protein n=1 Tax=Streptomyces fagopyri TaxID=2662397 RepID=UPI0037161521
MPRPRQGGGLPLPEGRAGLSLRKREPGGVLRHRVGVRGLPAAHYRREDPLFAGQATKVASEPHAPHEHVVVRSADGAGARCHEGAMFLLHQAIFNFRARSLD